MQRLRHILFTLYFEASNLEKSDASRNRMIVPFYANLCSLPCTERLLDSYTSVNLFSRIGNIGTISNFKLILAPREDSLRGREFNKRGVESVECMLKRQKEETHIAISVERV